LLLSGHALIATDRGEVAVEDLAIGDLLRTVSGALRPIKWIGHRAYAGRFIIGRKDILPVCIEVGVELDSHDVILAEGAWAESYLDDDNRGLFHNAHDFSERYP